ncbi:MAG: carboxypeptidase-like regulatory domain-containing protein, partial [Muribaculaceae bacterium]|nr:carboxypeptidase-like regulatory domain-containing protein [Muribaculaceae bacterium]
MNHNSSKGLSRAALIAMATAAMLAGANAEAHAAPAAAPAAESVVRSVSGTVLDNTGEPLIGASVIVKGTQQTAVTDIDGNFSIKNVKGKTLIVSYVGMKTKEVAIDADHLNITLEDNSEVLSEVVVVGYGTTTRKDVTGAVAKVDVKEM